MEEKTTEEIIEQSMKVTLDSIEVAKAAFRRLRIKPAYFSESSENNILSFHGYEAVCKKIGLVRYTSPKTDFDNIDDYIERYILEDWLFLIDCSVIGGNVNNERKENGKPHPSFNIMFIFCKRGDKIDVVMRPYMGNIYPGYRDSIMKYVTGDYFHIERTVPFDEAIKIINKIKKRRRKNTDYYELILQEKIRW